MSASPTSAHALRAERVTLSNGLPLVHNRATANPSVVVRLIARAGSSREAASEQGLANLTGRMLRQGTRGITKEALAEELDGLGMGLGVDVGYSVMAISLKCLSADFRRAVEILGELARYPTFPADELERLRGQVLTDLRELEDSTRVVAERTWRELAFPPSHPYHRLTSGTEETVQRFTRDDLAAFSGRWYVPNQAALVVVGDVTLDQARQVAEQVFGSWAPGDSTPVESSLPRVQAPTSQSREVEMAGKTQADLVVGRPAISRKDADYYPLAFANHVLGRLYFMGRFGEKVRDEQGLAYYAYSELHGGFGQGPWLVRAGVNPANLERARASIHAELERFLADGPTEAEQADGIQSLVGGLPRQLERNEGVAAALAEMELYDLGLDYLERYPEIIRGLTREQVTDAARRWLRPDALVTAIAGPQR